MKRKGEASWIDARSRWQISVQRDGTRKCFTSSTPGRKGKHEAEAKADAWLDDQTDDVTLGHAVDEFIRDKASRCACSTTAAAERVLKAVEDKIKPSRRLGSVTLREWREALYFVSEGLLKSTACNYRAIIVNFAGFCRSCRWEMEPLDTKVLPIAHDAGKGRARRALTEEEVREIMSLDEDDSPLAYAFQFCLLTGLRLGEMRGLQWGDVDVPAHILHLTRAINIAGEETSGKTVNAVRDVPLTDQALACLHRQKVYQAERGIVTQWIFDRTGSVIDIGTAENEWRRLKVTRIHADITIHELRHTFISQLKSEIPLPILKAVVGHSAGMDTIRVYGHTVEDDIAVAAQRMQDVQNRNGKK